MGCRDLCIAKGPRTQTRRAAAPNYKKLSQVVGLPVYGLRLKFRGLGLYSDRFGTWKPTYLLGPGSSRREFQGFG